MSDIGKYFPTSMVTMKSWLDIKEDTFDRYAVCSAEGCYKLYLDNRAVGTDTKVAQKCHAIEKRKNKDDKRTYEQRICNNDLTKKIKRNKAWVTVAKHHFCYRRLEQSLGSLLNSIGFVERINRWRTREVEANVLADVYDGKIWKDFSGVPYKFFDSRYNLALQLNVDWYQPFKRRSNKSIGVFYMVILNLPHGLRYKFENVILVAVMPLLPKEPEIMNTFLQPLVDTLKVLWRDGMEFSVISCSGNEEKVKVKAALLCVTCDLPAQRKLCGFMGVTALKACTRCTIDMGSKSRRNVGLFRTAAEVNEPGLAIDPRYDEDHRTKANMINDLEFIRTMTKESKATGVRYTALLQLDYYLPIRMCVIDPMHNLYMGRLCIILYYNLFFGFNYY